MKNTKEMWVIECTGCMVTHRTASRERAATYLARHEHDGGYDFVKVSRSGWRQLELLLRKAGTIEVPS